MRIPRNLTAVEYIAAGKTAEELLRLGYRTTIVYGVCPLTKEVLRSIFHSLYPMDLPLPRGKIRDIKYIFSNAVGRLDANLVVFFAEQRGPLVASGVDQLRLVARAYNAAKLVVGSRLHRDLSLDVSEAWTVILGLLQGELQSSSCLLCEYPFVHLRTPRPLCSWCESEALEEERLHPLSSETEDPLDATYRHERITPESHPISLQRHS